MNDHSAQPWRRPGTPAEPSAGDGAPGLADRVRVAQMRVPILLILAVSTALRLYSEAAY
jgi:hypothetical protein